MLPVCSFIMAKVAWAAAAPGDCSNGSTQLISALIKTKHMSLPCSRLSGRQAGRCALSADKRKDKGQVVQERRTRLAPHRPLAGHLSRRATKRNNRKLLLQLATTSAPTTGSSSASTSSCCKSSGSGTTTRVESEPPTDRFTLSSLPVSAGLSDLASFSDAITPD